ncbi:hypothetical protein [Thioalkalivibrio sp. ALE14]|uniref:hypothetical protein n=1 Tax=Thioalkalivibrio sp. ALE14 TaxID=1158168 RepID=UPI0003A1F284|nr:hypothetical protein [Thioalkalivibrio sp. ALE14]
MTSLDEMRRKANYRSMKRLAEALCEAVPEEPRQSRSVGAKLSDLNHGKTGWWERNSRFAERLAALLGCSKSDLGIHAAADPLATYRFEGFPEIRPLDLRREEACRVGYFSHKDRDCSSELDPWLGVRPGVAAGHGLLRGVYWVFFPPGTGLDLFWKQLNVSGPFECIAATSVHDVNERLLDPAPLCLRVSDSKGWKDKKALERRAPLGSVLIAAPFPLPEEFVSRSSLGRLLEDLSDSGLKGYEFILMRDWHQRLIDWLASRLRAQGGRKWDSDRLRQWVSDLPESGLVPTPRALVEVAGLSYRIGSGRLPSPVGDDAAEQWLSLVISGDPKTQRLFRDCVRAWLFSADVLWGSWIGAEDWKRVVETAVEAIQPHDSREVALSLLPEPIPQDPSSASMLDEAVGAADRLTEAGLLEEDAMGARRMTPHVAVHAIAVGDLQQVIANGDLGDWGALSFDPERSALVEDALADLGVDQIQVCAERSVRNAVFDAANIGAAEAVFLAGGQTLKESGGAPQSMIHLRDLVLDRLFRNEVAAGQSLSATSTRAYGWLAACWSWSLYTERPTFQLPVGWQQLFPGWVDTPSLELHGDIQIPDASVGLSGLPPAQQRLIDLAGEIADRIPTPLIDAQAVFHPSLLSRAVRDGSLVLWAWWETVMSVEWSRDVLSRKLHGSKDYTQALIRVFRALPRGGAELKQLQLWLLGASGVKKDLLEKAEAGAFVAGLDGEQLAIVASVFPLMPVTIQRGILDHCRDRTDAWDWWQRIEDGLTPELKNEVVGWVENSGPESRAAATWLWREQPQEAIRMLEKHLGRETGGKLLESYAGHQKSLERVVSLLECRSGPCPREIRSFAMAQLAESGHLAPRLLALMA